MKHAVTWMMLSALALAFAGCGGGGGEADGDASDAPDGDLPVDPPADDVGSEDAVPDVSPDDVAVDDVPVDDVAGEEAAGDCVAGPPVTFADGVAWARDLHVGAGQAYATLSAAAADALPGDRIVVHAGRYAGEYIGGLQGTAGMPIAVVGAPGEDPPVFGDSDTGLQMSDPAYVLLQGFIVESCAQNGINIDDGGDYATPAGPVVVRGVTVRDVGSGGNEDGLKMSGVDGFVVHGNTIRRWGTGGGSAVDMVGCHDGLIAGNRFEHTAGLDGNTGVQAKGGCRNVEIRGNLFLHAGARGVNMGGSTGDPYFRPAGVGYEASDIRVLANVFVGCQAAAAFVGCEDACLFAHNTVYLPEHWVWRIVNERPDLVPLSRDGRVLFNIVVVGSSLGTFVNIGPDTDPASFVFDGNLWFDADDPGFTMDGIPNDAGTPLPQSNAVVQEDPLLSNPASEDFSLGDGSPAIGAAGPLPERSLDYEEKCYADPASLGAVER
jgi:hypothetical protein